MEILICKNCKYYHIEMLGSFAGPKEFASCSNPDLGSSSWSDIDLVTGEITTFPARRPSCESQRKQDTSTFVVGSKLCGKEGRLYVRKDNRGGRSI